MKLYTYNISNLTENEYQKWYSLISPEKKAKVDRVKNENNRKCTVTGEMLARKGIAEALNISPEEIKFTVNEHGKPLAENTDIHFNISHCENIVICAVSQFQIGIDIEKIRPVNLKMANKICLKNEFKYIFGDTDSIDYDTQDEKLLIRFFEIWTGKEAYFKYTGTGITDFHSIDTLSCKLLSKPIIHDGFIIRTATEENI